MSQPDHKDLIDAAVRGDQQSIAQALPRFDAGCHEEPAHEDDDPWSFLNDFEPQKQDASLFENIKDTRGFNLLDLAYEQVILARADGYSPSHMTDVVLELLINKGARVSEATLGLLLPEKQMESLNRTELRTHCFRRTVGIFADAAFGFVSFGEASLLAQQKLATWGLYGIAYKINNSTDLTLKELLPRGNPIHPCLVRHARANVDGVSELRRFVQHMVTDEVMRGDLIRGGHAWRMLNEIHATPFFEADAARFFGELPQTDGAAADAMPKQFPHLILLAEDDDATRMKLLGRLEQMGFRVISAADGASALSMFRKYMSDIDLVITDLGMPELPGDDLLEAVRTLSATTPVILHSAAAGGLGEEFQNRVKAVGHAVFLAKNNPGRLEAEIRHALGISK